jgi:VWFA-related protein
VPETRRTFLIVLGYGRIQYPTKAVDGALAFVRERLLPQDLVAVMAFDRATDFTGDHDRIARTLERYRSEHERIVFEFDEWLRRRLGSNELPQPLRNDIDAIFTGVPTPRVKNRSAAWSTTGAPNGTMRATVPMLFGMNRAALLNEKPWDRSRTMADVEEEAGLSNRTTELSMIRSSVLKAYAGIEYLRYLDGEKHMLYLGGTGLVPLAPGHRETDKNDDAKLARRLNDARVTLDMVRTTGPSKPDFRSNRRSLDDLVLILGFQHIAELNGGTYTGVNYADRALAAVDRASRFSYLIGYAPSNPVLDGKYREVEVKVNRPGLVVRYRRGYFAVDEPDPLELRELITGSRLEAAAAFSGGARDIKLDVKATLAPRLGVTRQLRVDLRIDASRLAFVQTPSERAAELELRIYAGDEKEVLVGDWIERLTIRADEATQAGFVRDGVPHSVRMPVVGTPRYLKVLVYDYGSDLVGTFTLMLKDAG